jgi:hypothetical protein
MAYKLEKEPASGKKAFYQSSIVHHQQIIEEQLSQSTEVEPVTSPENVEVNKKIEVGEVNEPEQSDKDYVSVVKKVKKENITCDNIGEIMLCQIPGISSVSALAIMEKYKTLPNLLKEIEQNNDCLKDISHTNSKGQTRKISKTCAVNIVKYLLKK